MQKGVDYIGVTCGCLCLSQDGKILLQKRGRKVRDEQGKWDIGGGSVDFGERPEEAIVREMKEELGIKLKDLKFLGVETMFRTDHHGQRTHWISFEYSGIVTNPQGLKIEEDGKIEEFAWFTKDNLPEPLHPIIPIIMKSAEKAGLFN